MERIVFAIDVGTTKICTLVGEAREQGPLRIIGVGTSPSRGIEKGTVISVDEATQAIRASVAEAEQMSGSDVTHAVVGISGVHIAGVNSRGSADVARPTRGVSEEDIAHALEQAQTIAIPYSHEILQAIPRGYILDGQDSIRDPIGMYGRKLEVEAHLVTGASAPVNTLVKCVREAGVEVETLVLQSLASGQVVLTEEERESGVVLVDIGGGTTDVAIFIEGSVWHSAVIGRGGNLITRDLVMILQMPFRTAEELKIRCGHAESSEISDGENVEVGGFGDQPRRMIPRLLLAQIIEARVEQILGQVAEEIKRSGYSGLLPAGLVLCGGTAQLSGIRAVARRVLGLPVRIGAPQGVHGVVDMVSNPAYACGVGLLQWNATFGREHRESKPAPAGWSERLRDLLGRVLPG